MVGVRDVSLVKLENKTQTNMRNIWQEKFTIRRNGGKRGQHKGNTDSSQRQFA